MQQGARGVAEKMPGEKRQKINIDLAVRQTLFLVVVGKFLFKIPITWLEIGGIVFFGFVIEHVLIFIKERRISTISFAPLNTSLSTAIMLGSTNPFVYGVGLFIGLLQKHVLRIGGAHFLNPSNVAILVGLLFFSNETFVITTALGTTNTWWVAGIIAVSAAVIARSAKVLLVALAFIVFYLIFIFVFQTRNLLDVATLVMSGNFILFAFYMVPDPKAVPKTPIFRVLFAAMTAFLANALLVLWGPKYVNWFLALFISELFVPFWRFTEEHGWVKMHWIIAGLSYATLGVLCLLLYISPFNYVRNLYASFGGRGNVGSELDKRKEVLTDPGEATMGRIWRQGDQTLYESNWNSTHLVARPLTRGNSQVDPHPFVPVNGTLAGYKPTLSRQDLGGEYFPYAGITAGDINHDGYLDLVVSKVGQKLRVYMNDQHGGFIDVTRRMFIGDIPEDVEYVTLADFNNDTWLDLLVVYSQYRGPRRNTIYFFDPAIHRWRASAVTFGANKRSTGGVSVWDINGDKKLDFYISYGVNWLSERGDFQQHPYRDEFYVSDGNNWREVLKDYFPPELATQGYIGMTALFTDFDADGLPDFLLGNDAADPSFTLVGQKDGKFHLIDKNKIEQNTRSSMSYFPLDADSDGVFELFEAGITYKQVSERKSPIVSADTLISGILSNGNTGRQEGYIDQFQKAAKDIELGVYHCEQFTNPYVAATCADKRLTMAALQKNDRRICDAIIGRGERALCQREWGILNKQNLPNPLALRFDPEKFPKKLGMNSLLRLDSTNGRYRQVFGGDDVAYTNWTWTAYPFDINNDGLLDLYLTSGAVFYSHDTGNKLLINETHGGNIHFTDRTKGTPLALRDDSRGVIIADFRNSGQGDIVVNNFMAEPKYFVNQAKGDSIEVELRSKNSNYYAVGAQIILVTATGKQIREINQGGIWQSAQPFMQHFGLKTGDHIQSLLIRWPDGHTQRFQTITPSNRYIIYE